MSGDPIEAVNEGIRTLHSNLLDDPQALETAYISVITFASEAKQFTPLVSVTSFIPPQLHANGTTALGAALQLLCDSLEDEKRKMADGLKDWKPLVFLLTDGAPTDTWQDQAEILKKNRPANIIAVACGADANTSILRQITGVVLELRNTGPDGFKKFFEWVSASVRQTSHKLGQAPADAQKGVALSPLPPEIVIIP